MKKNHNSKFKFVKSAYQALTQTNYNMIILLKDKKNIYLNSSAFKDSNYAEEEDLKQNISVLLLDQATKDHHSKHTTKHHNSKHDCLINDNDSTSCLESYTAQIIAKKKTIQSIPRSFSVMPQNETNSPLITFGNIANQKILEQEELIKKLEQKNQKLTALIKMKDEFLSITSHDLRSPFITLLGYAELLLEENNLSPEDKQYVERIKSNAENQLNYVNALLTILELDSEKIPLKSKSTDIGQLIESLVNNHKTIAKSKNINLEIINNANKIINVDSEKIMQVINNLITNAIKFTPPFGTISIATMFNKNNRLEIHVRDTGVGIQKKHKKNLFSRNKKFHTEGTSGEKGNGLGLAICKNLIKLHGGTIRHKNNKPQGSDFYFCIPVTSCSLA